MVFNGKLSSKSAPIGRRSYDDFVSNVTPKEDRMEPDMNSISESFRSVAMRMKPIRKNLSSVAVLDVEELMPCQYRLAKDYQYICI